MLSSSLSQRPRSTFLAVGALALPLVGFTAAGHAQHNAARIGSAQVSAAERAIPAAATFTVAPDGSGFACTPEHPCSLTTAQYEARKIEPKAQTGVAIELEDGTYHLSKTFRLTQRDSGRHGAPVIYRAADGAHPVLSGAEPVTGWRKVAGTPNWSVEIAKDFDTRQLYVNGKRVSVARGLPSGRMVQTPTGLIATDPSVAGWVNPSNVHVLFRGGNGPWTETQCPIASISGVAITMAQPCWDNLHLKAMGVQELAWFDDPMGGFGGLGAWKTPSAFDNLYSALSPGHWTIDRVAHRLYYQPRKGESVPDLDIEVPALQTLFAIDGTPEQPVHDVIVRGLTFSYGTWTGIDTNNGFPQMQADWYLTGKDANTRQGTCQYNNPHGTCPFASWTRTPANVVLTATSHVQLVGNTFTHLGGAGLDLYEGATHDLVEGNEFTDIGASAIQLGATDDPLPQKRYGGMRERHNTVANNYIHEVANQYLGGIGIWLGYTTHSRIVHNYIEHVPYTAISIGWGGWHQFVLASHRNPNGNAHNLVANNLMYDYMHILGDGGAIYSNGSQATSWKTALQELGNVAYRGTNNDFSLYTDAASQYVKIGGNFVYFQPVDSFSTGGCHTVGHIRIFHNFFSQGGPAYPCAPYTDMVVNDDMSVCQVPMPAEAPKAILRRAGLKSSFRHLMNRYRPEVDLVGPEQLSTSGGEVMISGRGFTPSSVVKFNDKVATKVKLINSNYLFVTAPAGSGTVPVTVTNAHGKSAQNAYSHLTYAAAPMPCQLSSGTGVTLGLIS